MSHGLRALWLAPLILCGAILLPGSPTSADPYHLQVASETTSGGVDNVDSARLLAQSFTATTTFRISRVSVYVQDVSPSDVLAVYVRSSVGGWPATANLTQGSVDAGTTPAWIDIDLSPWADLSGGTVYWIVLRSAASGGYSWSHSPNDMAYLGGIGAESPDGISWSPRSRDYAFRVYGFEQPDLTFAASVSDGNPRPGDSPVFRADITNSGTGNGPFVWVNVTLPPELTYISDDAAASGGTKTGNYTFVFTNVSSGSLSFNLTTSVIGGVPDGTVALTRYTFDFTDHNGVPQPRATRTAPIVIRNARLALSHTSNASLVDPGDLVTYNATAQNVGQETASDVGLVGVLDPAASFVSLSPGAAYDPGSRTVRRTGLTLAVSERASMEWTVRIQSGAADGTSVASTSQASYSDLTGMAMPPTSAAAPVTVRAPVFPIGLAVDRAEAEANDVVFAALTYNNTGSAPAPRAWANWTTSRDYALLSLVPAIPYTTTSEGFDVALMNVVPGSHALVARLRVVRGLSDGASMPIQVRWLATDGNGNPLSSPPLTVSLGLRAPRLTISATADAPRAEVDSTFVVTVTLRNEGRAAASGWLNLSLPFDVLFVADNGSFAVTAAGNVVSWRIPSAAPGSRTDLALTLRGKASGPKLFRFALDYTDDAGTPPASVSSNGVTVEVVPTAFGGFLGLWWPVLLALAAGVGLAAYALHRRASNVLLEDAFVVDKTGILLAHQSSTLLPYQDDDILVAMLTTVQQFVKDAFARGTDEQMHSMSFGKRTVRIIRGRHHYIAVVYRGQDSGRLAQAIRALSEKIDARLGDTFAQWAGDMESVRDLTSLLSDLWGRRKFQAS